MTKKSYTEKFKDPRWQKKRLEILNRDDWRCRKCLKKEKTLHVHHCGYIWGREPWEYEDSWFLTLCEDCHAHETEFLKEVKNDVLSIASLFGYTVHDYELLASLIIDMAQYNISFKELEDFMEFCAKRRQESQA